jgi:ABC-type uncharacterized transport system fused permease/ATPase subunit
LVLFPRSSTFTLIKFPYKDFACPGDSLNGKLSPSKNSERYSKDAISFMEVDIITPAQKLLARQLTFDIGQGKSLLLTG